MKNGIIRFTEVGSDNVVYETPYPSAIVAFTRARLKAAGNTSFSDDIDALASYGAFMLAEVNGNSVVDLPAIESVTPADVLTACLKVDIAVIRDEEKDEGRAEGNPTGSKGERF